MLHGAFLVRCDQFSQKGRPTCLVTGTQAHSCITVKIFIEKIQMFVARLLVKPVILAILRYAACFIRLEKTDHALSEKIRYIFQVHIITRAYRTFNFQSIPIKYSVFTNGLDDEVVDWHPYGAAPIGISTKKI